MRALNYLTFTNRIFKSFKNSLNAITRMSTGINLLRNNKIAAVLIAKKFLVLILLKLEGFPSPFPIGAQINLRAIDNLIQQSSFTFIYYFSLLGSETNVFPEKETSGLEKIKESTLLTFNVKQGYLHKYL